MGIPGILGILGFVFALGLSYLEWHRYRIPLQLRLREVVHVGASKDTHLILFRLSVVNPASRGRTVYDVGLADLPNNVIVKQLRDYHYEEGHDTLVYELPNDKNVNTPIHFDELLWLPLDIPPHQSRSGFVAYVITEGKQDYMQKGIHFHFVARDASLPPKKIAEYQKKIELRNIYYKNFNLKFVISII